MYDAYYSRSHRWLVERQGAEHGSRMQHVSMQVSLFSNTSVPGFSSAAVIGVCRAAIGSRYGAADGVTSGGLALASECW